MELAVEGWCPPEFAAVREAFTTNFTERGEVGAAVHIVRDGEVLVDLWGGWRDEATTIPWTGDTLVNCYSATKAITATLLLQFVDAGDIGLDTRVAEVWPEFGVGGKSTVTVRQALAHEAAVPAIRERLTDDDLLVWSRMADALAATDAWWEVGTRHAYHTNTFGHLVGEIVRRVGGEMPGGRLRRITDDIGADVHIGVPEADHARCADVIWALPTDATAFDLDALEGDARMTALAYFNPPGYSSMGIVNTAHWRSNEVPSTNGHASARGLARFYAALIEPDHLLSTPLLATATAPGVTGPCPILGEDVAFGLGFTPTSARRPLGIGPRAFGHFGTGGALGYADPDRGLAFGYVMNHVIPRWQSTRNRALIDALEASLA